MNNLASALATTTAQPGFTLASDQPAGYRPAGSGAEQLLDLHERLLGAPDVDALIAQILAWGKAYGIFHDLTYSQGTDADTEAQPFAPTPNYRHHHTAVFPVLLENERAGELTFIRRQGFLREELLLLEEALRRIRGHLKMVLTLQTYRRQALHDGLTGLLNRKSLDDRLAQELSKTQRHGGSLSLMLIDVDHFKDLNDRLGHPCGDRVLKSLADIFRSETRESDLSFRYGGDEFAILLPATGLSAARRTAERICRKLRAVPIEAVSINDGTTLLHPQLSIGVAEYLPGDSEADLLQRVDTHLYRAKAQGRGGICAQT